MTRSYARSSRTRSATKTLYTPVFYPTSQSSASGSTLPADIPEAYLDYLSRKHIALAQIVQEVPSSRCASPVEGEDDSEQSASKARVDALHRRVKEAIKYADGDPADGKWGFVARMLRLNTTRRRRWLRSTTAGKPAESSAGWINARSEKEWEEWEVKWKQEEFLKQKVQSWQEKVDKHLVGELVPVVSISQDPEDASSTAEKQPIQPEGAKVKRITTLQTASNPSTTLGFPVVKRSSLNVVGKPKPSGKPLASGAVAESPKLVPESSLHDIRDPQPPIGDSSSPASKPQQRNIGDISETSFLPPSFHSQLQTSTPNAKTDKRHKPEPIILVPPSSPLSTPPSVRVYGRQQLDISSSLTDPPPSRNPKPDSTSSRAPTRDKRPRSVTPQHAVKKARTASAQASSSSDRVVPPSTPPPPPLPLAVAITPQRAQLPTLTELLASAKKAKSSPKGKAKKMASRATSSAAPPPPPPPPQPKLPEPEPEPEFEPAPIPQLVQESTSEPQVEAYDPGLPHFSGPDAADPSLYERLSYNMGLEPGMAPEYDYDMASPTKSLSSLAASDSDEEQQDLDQGMGMDLDLSGGGFEPPFGSTQVGEKGMGWPGYNSQFDVDGKVDIVSKFMEKDVDYNGWLRDPSVEADVVERP